MKNFLTVVNFVVLLRGSFCQSENYTIAFPGGLLSEVFHLITNGTIQHFDGCKSQDNFTENDIAYYLFTRKTRDRTALTFENLCELDPSKDVKIIWGGWLQTTEDSIILDMVKAYLTRYDCNVILVEYINLTNTEYTQAYCNVIKGAEMMADFFCDMHSEGYLDFNKVHMLGMSLGAQVIGLVGQGVQKTCNQKVDRLTGLDPAGPIYQNQDISMRLDKSDGNFVDVIHTNGGMFGYYGSMGHVDFFPNCGTVQAGCIRVSPDIVQTIATFILCSHGRSFLLFTESIYGPVFKSTSCTLCPNRKGMGQCQGADIINRKHTIMGEDCPRNPPAKRFHLKTNSKSPYAKA